MRIRLIPTILLPVAILAACAVATPERENTTAQRETPEPRIVFPEGAEHDFGVIKQSGGVVRHDFPFTYEGNAPITITGTPTSCACTGASVDRTILNPGESGVLTVTLNPNLHAEPPGRFFKTALILTDPPIGETPEATIFAEIDLDLGPEAFELQDDHGDPTSPSTTFEESGAGLRGAGGSGGEHDDGQDAAANLSGAAQAGHIEIEATVIGAANIETLKQTYGAALESALFPPDRTTVLLVLDNHREDLSQYDYRSLTSLDGTGAEEWQQLSSAMGGHHVAGVLTFPKTRETLKEIRIAGVSVGEIVISLTKSP